MQIFRGSAIMITTRGGGGQGRAGGGGGGTFFVEASLNLLLGCEGHDVLVPQLHRT